MLKYYILTCIINLFAETIDLPIQSQCLGLRTFTQLLQPITILTANGSHSSPHPLSPSGPVWRAWLSDPARMCFTMIEVRRTLSLAIPLLMIHFSPYAPRTSLFLTQLAIRRNILHSKNKYIPLQISEPRPHVSSKKKSPSTAHNSTTQETWANRCREHAPTTNLVKEHDYQTALATQDWAAIPPPDRCRFQLKGGVITRPEMTEKLVGLCHEAHPDPDAVRHCVERYADLTVRCPISGVPLYRRLVAIGSETLAMACCATPVPSYAKRCLSALCMRYNASEAVRLLQKLLIDHQHCDLRCEDAAEAVVDSAAEYGVLSVVWPVVLASLGHKWRPTHTFAIKECWEYDWKRLGQEDLVHFVLPGGFKPHFTDNAATAALYRVCRLFSNHSRTWTLLTPLPEEMPLVEYIREEASRGANIMFARNVSQESIFSCFMVRAPLDCVVALLTSSSSVALSMPFGRTFLGYVWDRKDNNRTCVAGRPSHEEGLEILRLLVRRPEVRDNEEWDWSHHGDGLLRNAASQQCLCAFWLVLKTVRHYANGRAPIEIAATVAWQDWAAIPPPDRCRFQLKGGVITRPEMTEKLVGLCHEAHPDPDAVRHCVERYADLTVRCPISGVPLYRRLVAIGSETLAMACCATPVPSYAKRCLSALCMRYNASEAVRLLQKLLIDHQHCDLRCEDAAEAVVDSAAEYGVLSVVWPVVLASLGHKWRPTHTFAIKECWEYDWKRLGQEDLVHFVRPRGFKPHFTDNAATAALYRLCWFYMEFPTMWTPLTPLPEEMPLVEYIREEVSRGANIMFARNVSQESIFSCFMVRAPLDCVVALLTSSSSVALSMPFGRTFLGYVWDRKDNNRTCVAGRPSHEEGLEILRLLVRRPEVRDNEEWDWSHHGDGLLRNAASQQCLCAFWLVLKTVRHYANGRAPIEIAATVAWQDWAAIPPPDRCRFQLKGGVITRPEMTEKLVGLCHEAHPDPDAVRHCVERYADLTVRCPISGVPLYRRLVAIGSETLAMACCATPVPSYAKRCLSALCMRYNASEAVRLLQKLLIDHQHCDLRCEDAAEAVVDSAAEYGVLSVVWPVVLASLGHKWRPTHTFAIKECWEYDWKRLGQEDLVHFVRPRGFKPHFTDNAATAALYRLCWFYMEFPTMWTPLTPLPEEMPLVEYIREEVSRGANIMFARNVSQESIFSCFMVRAPLDCVVALLTSSSSVALSMPFGRTFLGYVWDRKDNNRTCVAGRPSHEEGLEILRLLVRRPEVRDNEEWDWSHHGDGLLRNAASQQCLCAFWLVLKTVRHYANGRAPIEIAATVAWQDWAAIPPPDRCRFQLKGGVITRPEMTEKLVGLCHEAHPDPDAVRHCVERYADLTVRCPISGVPLYRRLVAIGSETLAMACCATPVPSYAKRCLSALCMRYNASEAVRLLQKLLIDHQHCDLRCEDAAEAVVDSAAEYGVLSVVWLVVLASLGHKWRPTHTFAIKECWEYDWKRLGQEDLVHFVRPRGFKPHFTDNAATAALYRLCWFYMEFPTMWTLLTPLPEEMPLVEHIREEASRGANIMFCMTAVNTFSDRSGVVHSDCYGLSVGRTIIHNALRVAPVSVVDAMLCGGAVMNVKDNSMYASLFLLPLRRKNLFTESYLSIHGHEEGVQLLGLLINFFASRLLLEDTDFALLSTEEQAVFKTHVRSSNFGLFLNSLSERISDVLKGDRRYPKMARHNRKGPAERSLNAVGCTYRRIQVQAPGMYIPQDLLCISF
eukprot:gene11250-7818_t